MPDVNSGRRWTPTGRPAKNGPMLNWQMWQPPRRRLKKGAPNEPPGRNPPGNRNARRPSCRPGSRFRSCGDGGAAAGVATGRARTGTTAECRHQRSCGLGSALLLRSTGPISWPSPKDVRKRLGPLHLERAYYYCAQCESGFCPRDRALRLEMFSLTPGVLRMTGSTAALVSFEESSALLHELAGVEVSVKQGRTRRRSAGGRDRRR